jgi:alanine dehydrogenase
VKYLREKEENLLNLKKLKSLCKWDKKLLEMIAAGRVEQTCYFSLPQAVMILNNKTDCMQLTSSDVRRFLKIVRQCYNLHASGVLYAAAEEYKQKQKQKIHDSIVKADIVITTAQIPGKRAPILITREMVEGMRAGSIIIDIASATGGNCELTRNNETVIYNGVTIIGNSNLPSNMPNDASKLYGKNLLNFMKLLITEDGKLNLNFEDELIKGCCITFDGKVVNERIIQIALQN